MEKTVARVIDLNELDALAAVGGNDTDPMISAY